MELTKYSYEGRATGIPTIQRELKANGSDPARIETNDECSYFLITIPCRKEFLYESEAADTVTRQEKDLYLARKNAKNQQTKQNTRQEDLQVNSQVESIENKNVDSMKDKLNDLFLQVDLQVGTVARTPKDVLSCSENPNNLGSANFSVAGSTIFIIFAASWKNKTIT